MAQLFYKYGTMNAGKSLNLLAIAHNYEEQGKKVLILTSKLDNRSGIGTVSSRVGIRRPAIPIDETTDIVELVDNAGPIDAVLIDEAQFMTYDNVIDCVCVVDYRKIPVICFGLKSDFAGNLFTGSKALFENADKIEEIKTVCQWCNKKATMNLRTENGHPVYIGNNIQIGDSEYISVCRYHYYQPAIEEI